MPQWLLTIQYDGTRYHGWQVQPNGITVQQTLQDAVESISGVRADITGCSRTDAGVHAERFCCTTAVNGAFTPAGFVKGLNAVLPPDVAVLSCRTVPDSFHPRYSAKRKRYVYRIWNAKERSAFWYPYSLHVRKPLDENSLNKTASLFCGTHDFSAFCAAKSDVEDKTRTVFRSQVTRKGDMVLYTVEADGFLYNMVRILVGTLLDVENGKRTLPDVKRALETGDRNAAGHTAPPQGLSLSAIIYEEETDVQKESE